MSLLQEYYAATEREFTAPSKIVYRLRGLSAAEYGGALKGIPALATDGSGGRAGTDIEAALAMQRDVCRAGTISMAWGNKVASGAEMGPPESWPVSDVSAVFLKIQELSHLSGPDAEAARRAV